MPLSLQDQFATAEAVTLFGRLFALDQVRTDYLERVEEPISEDDVSVLEYMTHVIEDHLAEAGRRAAYLNRIIELHPEELDKGYVRMLWTDALSGDQKMRLRGRANRRATFRTWQLSEGLHSFLTAS